jgi:uncharacterized protein YecT (DUF1311 family)
MKTFVFILFMIFAGSEVFCQTQTKMNLDAKSKFDLADKQLNDIYKRILNDYKEDIKFTEQLRVSQRIWIQFRDAEMLVKFPEKDASYYGSVFSMCWYSYKEELTSERIKRLRLWLIGTDEGDVCSGSIKFN